MVHGAVTRKVPKPRNLRVGPEMTMHVSDQDISSHYSILVYAARVKLPDLTGQPSNLSDMRLNSKLFATTVH